MDELDKQIKKLPAELRVCIFEQLLIILTEQEEYSQVIEFLGESHPFSPVVVCQILKKCGKFSHLAIAAYANHHPLTQKMINIALSTSKCPSAIIENDTIVKQMDRTTILGIIHQYPLVALGKIEMTEEIPRILQRGTSEELANDIIKSIPTSSYKDNIYYILTHEKMKQYITNEVLKKLSETINMNDTFLCMWNDDDRITTDDYIHFYLKN